MSKWDEISNVRAVYNLAAESYADFAGTTVTPATETQADRELLASFVDAVRAGERGVVADLGCGPGRVAALLATGGLAVIGVDMATKMLDIAKRAHPKVSFAAGLLDALPVSKRSLAAAVCWYSFIHTPPGALSAVCAEVSRVLADDGWLLVAFQAGDGSALHRSNAYDTGIEFTSYRHVPEHVTGHLSEVGLRVEDTVVRPPVLAHESAPQAFIVARACREGSPRPPP